MFAKDNGFTSEQMSAWFSIIKSVHEMAVGEDPFVIIVSITDFLDNTLLERCHQDHTYVHFPR